MMPSTLSPRQHFERQVAQLVEKFDRQRAHYLSTAYNETDVRAEFIDPLFEALGWDVSNRAGYGPHDKEVIREKSEVSGRSDYQFQLNGRAMFIVEAKAPHVPLDRTDVIMQAKKYAWNSKDTSIAAITDFEEFRLYDATVKPDPKHPDMGLIFAARYTDYLKPKTADDLWLLSKEAVAAGSIEQLLKMSSVKQRERLPVDVAFLDDLTAWREKLAKAVFKIEPEIEPADLNSVVQVFLDRLIFIRFAEDHGILAKRGLEDVARLWERSGKHRSIVNDLNALFHEVNDLLNGEIFKPHRCEKIDWDQEAALVAKIIQALYDGPYRFDVIGVELLGSIYERYLGKTIRVTASRAIVEDKPEVRKAGGVYYTPRYIVDYIVEQTVGKLIEGKTPAQIAKLKILDPACGSGSFLLGAYQKLIEYHERWYAGKRTPSPALPRSTKGASNKGRSEASPPVDAVYRRGEPEGGQLPLLDAGEGGEYRLPLAEKAAILRNNLFGVDIDPQAVEITMMSLYIKLLEGERGAMMGRGILPPLRDNIKCGNSLIGYDIREQPGITDEDVERIRPFDWHSRREGFGEILAAGGFDAVIGNPPWGANIDDTLDYFHAKFTATTQEHTDSFKLFIENNIGLARKNGLVSLIVPNTILRQRRLKDVRSLMLSFEVVEVVDLGEDVFKGVVAPSCVFVLRRTSPSSEHKVRIANLAKLDDDAKAESLRSGIPTAILFDQKSARDNPDLEFASTVKKHGLKMPVLGEMRELECKDAGINYQRVSVGMQAKGKSDLAKRLLYEGKRQRARDRMYWKGSDIDRYWIADATERWCRPDYQDFIRANEVVHLNEQVYATVPKILLRQTADHIIATIDEKGVWFGRSIIAILLSPESKYQARYFLGLLNSRYFHWLYDSLVNEAGRVFAQVKLSKLKQLPIRTIDFTDPADRARHDRMVSLVQRMLDLHKQLQAAGSEAARQRLQREINVTDEQIDRLVYELYGLTEEEIKIVEGR